VLGTEGEDSIETERKENLFLFKCVWVIKNRKHSGKKLVPLSRGEKCGKDKKRRGALLIWGKGRRKKLHCQTTKFTKGRRNKYPFSKGVMCLKKEQECHADKTGIPISTHQAYSKRKTGKKSK